MASLCSVPSLCWGLSTCFAELFCVVCLTKSSAKVDKLHSHLSLSWRQIECLFFIVCSGSVLLPWLPAATRKPSDQQPDQQQQPLLVDAKPRKGSPITFQIDYLFCASPACRIELGPNLMHRNFWFCHIAQLNFLDPHCIHIIQFGRECPSNCRPLADSQTLNWSIWSGWQCHLNCRLPVDCQTIAV